MHRTIAAAALVFGIAAFALHQSTMFGSLEEPMLLLVMGSLFVVLGRFFTPAEEKVRLAPQQERVA